MILCLGLFRRRNIIPLSLAYFSSKPTSSEVLTAYLTQCNEPPWTSYFVKVSQPSSFTNLPLPDITLHTSDIMLKLCLNSKNFSYWCVQYKCTLLPTYALRQNVTLCTYAFLHSWIVE